MSYSLVLTGLSQGLILSLVAFAIMISFRYLNLQDLTIEGSYSFGGALCAFALLSHFHPLFAIGFAVVTAGILGLFTGFLYLRFGMNTLLAGIIVSTMVYSVNLRLLGKSNVALFANAGLFNVYFTLVVAVVIIMICFRLFLNTEIGLRFRAVGLNPAFVKQNGISLQKYSLAGLYISNCIAGLGGSLMVILLQYMDVGMSRGIVIHALAALMIGESVLGQQTPTRQIVAPIVGAVRQTSRIRPTNHSVYLQSLPGLTC